MALKSAYLSASSSKVELEVEVIQVTLGKVIALH